MTTKTNLATEEMRLTIELRRLLDESDKFRAEQRKLIAEAAKLERDRWFAPIVVTASVAAGIGSTIVAIISHMLK